jgi:hypothetical protein
MIAREPDIPPNERILDACDAAASQHPLDRALTLLALLDGDAPERLAELAIGERDARLLAVRRRFFGDRIEAVCPCTACGELNEFTLDAAELPERTGGGRLVIQSEGGRALRLRFPDSRDVAAVAGLDPEAATRALAERCVLDDAIGLSDREIAEFDARLAEADGIAALEIAFTCPACGAAESASFDIASFLWRDLSGRCRQLLGEVDALAFAYGWSQREILALPERRRDAYVRLVTR